MSYYLYILYSKVGDRYYAGSSEYPIRRLKFHNTIEKGFTSRYRPWELVYTKEYGTKAEALAAERKIKRYKSRRMIEGIIKGIVDV
ncbi:MAG: GIY-YIG nuclease family protein [Bacteroidetes bacterium]|nr:GIY-YIG nuclease family protein [Bacteroidota bacterium]MCL5738182.1 GIY-YIG nuclease family protein [Bacteroidota bacterium]